MDPLETLIIREQQRFELLIQVNPVQVTINDNRILNIKKKKHSYYKLTQVGCFRRLWKMVQNKYL